MLKNPAWFHIVLLLLLLAGGVPVAALAAPPEPPAITRASRPEVLVERELELQLLSTEGIHYWIDFHAQADLTPAYGMDWETRGEFVARTLQETAASTQAEVRAYLDAQGVQYHAYWIANVIVVEASDSATLNGLRHFSEIAALRAPRQVILYKPEPERESPLTQILATVESNLVHLGAEQVWALGYTGQNIVVGSIDTGVNYTHEALVQQYRGNLGNGAFDHNYNWYDPPAAGDNDLIPNDFNNHGSHIMGTIVGSTNPDNPSAAVNTIGMAPGAQWIACQALETGSAAELLACAQFMLAPHDLTGANPNPALRPHIVNNSWGDCGLTYNGWFQGSVDAWVAAGMYPVFAVGNAGNCGYSTPPGLGTVGNPARYGNVTAVGATGRSDGAYASYSNWGPSDVADTVNPAGYPHLKPQVVAPDLSRSALRLGNTYGDLGGSSISAAHVSGLVALMWSAAPCLTGDYTQTETLIQQTANPLPYATGNGDEGPGNVPNHATGWGEIDALAAVLAAEAYCADLGILNGTVVEAGTGTPIEGALIAASNVTRTRQLATAATGFYSATLPAETYNVTARAYGYQAQTVSDVALVPGAPTTEDFTLTPGASYTLNGHISDANTGWPLYASVEIVPEGFPAQTVWTDPWTGAYTVTLMGDYPHTLYVATWDGLPGYLPQSRAVNLTGDAVENFALAVEVAVCEAPGYTSSATTILNQGFEGELFPPTGWARYNLDGAGTQWVRTELRANTGSRSARHNFSLTPISGQDGWLRTPALALGSAPVLSFWENADWVADYVNHSLWVCTSGCTSPPTNYTKITDFAGPQQGVWRERVVDLSAYANQTVYLAWRYRGYDAADWYIDDVLVRNLSCTPPATGGLLAGHVYDAHTLAPLNGAHVRNSLNNTATARAIPEDAALDDGFYALYAPAGAQTFTATRPWYADAVVSDYAVQNGATQRQDFYLGTGLVSAFPSTFREWLSVGASKTVAWTLPNASPVAANFNLVASGPGAPTDVVADGSFELGIANSPWNQYSTNFGTPLCDERCGRDNARTGDWYVWFGGTSLEETGSVDQAVAIPRSLATLTFWLQMGVNAGAEGYLAVSLDGVELFRVTEADKAAYTAYTLVSLDASLFADEGTHNLRFEAYHSAGAALNFFVDDVALEVAPPLDWLSKSLTSGTIVDSNAQSIDVTFDATALTAGVYTGTLHIASDTPYSPQDVPVELTVGAEYASIKTGDWSGSAWASGSPTANDIVTITTGTTVTLDVNAQSYSLHVEPGGTLVIPQGYALTVERSVENYGKLVETRSVNATTEFLHLRNQTGDASHYYGVVITPAADMGQVEVAIRGNQACTTAGPDDTVNRCFDIEPGTVQTADIRFYYLDAEIPTALDENALKVWHWEGAYPWVAASAQNYTLGGSGEYRWIEAQDVSGYSPFVISSKAAGPTAIRLRSLSGQGNTAAALFGIALAIGTLTRRKRR